MAHNGGRCTGNFGVGGSGYGPWCYISSFDQSPDWFDSTETINAEDYFVDDNTWFTGPPPNGAHWYTGQLRIFGADGDIWVFTGTGTCNAWLQQYNFYGPGGMQEVAVPPQYVIPPGTWRKHYKIVGTTVPTFYDLPNGSAYFDLDADGKVINNKSGEYGFSYLIRAHIENQVGPVGKLRLYRLEHEALIQQGQRYLPYLWTIVEGVGCLRMMDQTGVNGCPAVTDVRMWKPANIPQSGGLWKPGLVKPVTKLGENYYEFPVWPGKPEGYHGLPIMFDFPDTPTLRRMTVKASYLGDDSKTLVTCPNHGWQDGDLLYRCVDWGKDLLHLPILSITKANPGVFHCPGHGFNWGEEISFAIWRLVITNVTIEATARLTFREPHNLTVGSRFDCYEMDGVRNFGAHVTSIVDAYTVVTDADTRTTGPYKGGGFADVRDKSGNMQELNQMIRYAYAIDADHFYINQDTTGLSDYVSNGYVKKWCGDVLTSRNTETRPAVLPGSQIVHRIDADHFYVNADYTYRDETPIQPYKSWPEEVLIWDAVTKTNPVTLCLRNKQVSVGNKIKIKHINGITGYSTTTWYTVQSVDHSVKSNGERDEYSRVTLEGCDATGWTGSFVDDWTYNTGGTSRIVIQDGQYMAGTPSVGLMKPFRIKYGSTTYYAHQRSGAISNREWIINQYTGKWNRFYGVLQVPYGRSELDPNYTTFVMGNGNVYEHQHPSIMADAANAVGSHLWYNISLFAPDDYIDAVVGYFLDALGDGQQLWIEGGNEIWNFMFPSFEPLRYLGSLCDFTVPNNGSPVAGKHVGAMDWRNMWGMRVQNIFKRGRAVAAAKGKPDKLKCVFGGFTEWNGDAEAIYAWSPGELAVFDEGYNTGQSKPWFAYGERPIDMTDYCAWTVYWGPPFNNLAPNSSNQINYPGWKECVYNWKTGNKTAAFDWFKAQCLSSANRVPGAEVNWAGQIDQITNYFSPGPGYPTGKWDNPAIKYDFKNILYEGGVHFSSQWIAGGFSGWNYDSVKTDVNGVETYTLSGWTPYNGVNLTSWDVQHFVKEFFLSQQYADCVRAAFQGFLDASPRNAFPAQYTMGGTHSFGYNWALWPQNTTDWAQHITPAVQVFRDVNLGVGAAPAAYLTAKARLVCSVQPIPKGFIGAAARLQCTATKITFTSVGAPFDDIFDYAVFDTDIADTFDATVFDATVFDIFEEAVSPTLATAALIAHASVAAVATPVGGGAGALRAAGSVVCVATRSRARAALLAAVATVSAVPRSFKPRTAALAAAARLAVNPTRLAAGATSLTASASLAVPARAFRYRTGVLAAAATLVAPYVRVRKATAALAARAAAISGYVLGSQTVTSARCIAHGTVACTVETSATKSASLVARAAVVAVATKEAGGSAALVARAALAVSARRSRYVEAALTAQAVATSKRGAIWAAAASEISAATTVAVATATLVYGAKAHLTAVASLTTGGTTQTRATARLYGRASLAGIAAGDRERTASLHAGATCVAYRTRDRALGATAEAFTFAGAVASAERSVDATLVAAASIEGQTLALRTYPEQSPARLIGI